MIVYAELVMLINFLVDLLLLIGTNQLAGFPGNGKRIFLAAALGGLYAGACLLPGFSFLSNGLWQLVSLAGMTGIAFGISKSALRRGILFFLLSMALGGLATGLGSRTLWTIVLAAAGLWLMCLLGFGGGSAGDRYLPISVTCGEKTIRLTALVDTGNTLKDPISGRQVLVADHRAAAGLLGLTGAQLVNPLQTMVSHPGLRLIPYRTVGKSAGMLLAVQPDTITVEGKPVHMLLAFAPEEIGRNQAFDALAGGAL